LFIRWLVFLFAMDARDATNTEDRKVPEVGPTSTSIDNLLYRQLEQRDSRLSALETSLRDVQQSIQMWSAIIQDGLADMSVKVKLASQDPGFMQQVHLGSETWDDSKIWKRLSEVEQKVEAMQSDALEIPRRVASMAKAEHKLQELQTSIQKVLVKFLPEAQDSPEGPVRCLDMTGTEQISHSRSVQRLSTNIVVPAASSRSQPLMRSPGGSTVLDSPISSKNTAIASLRPSPRQMPLLHVDRVQNKFVTRTPSPQLQTRQTMPTLSGCLSRRQQDKNGDGLTALPLTNMQIVASRCWQQTCVANDMSVKLMKGSSTGSLQDVNPQMAALLSPKWRTRS